MYSGFMDLGLKAAWGLGFRVEILLTRVLGLGPSSLDHSPKLAPDSSEHEALNLNDCPKT